MQHAFSRIDPNRTYLQRPYRAYQALVAEQWGDTWPIPPDKKVPIQIRHIQRVRPLISADQTPEQRNRRKLTDAYLEDPFVLAATGTLAVELEERARWLAGRGRVITDKTTGKGKYHQLEASLPLELDESHRDAKAVIELYSARERLRGRRQAIPCLGYLSVHFSSTYLPDGERIRTYASISEDLLALARPDSAEPPPKVLYSPSLLDGFELRDMLTFVENNAPDALLPKQAHPMHVVQDPAKLPQPPAH